jgi:hypothetical protein
MSKNNNPNKKKEDKKKEEEKKKKENEKKKREEEKKKRENERKRKEEDNDNENPDDEEKSDDEEEKKNENPDDENENNNPDDENKILFYCIFDNGNNNNDECNDPGCEEDHSKPPHLKRPHDDDDDDNNDDKDDPDSRNALDNLFKVILNKNRLPQPKRKKENPKNDFYDYFLESDKLLPINREIKTLNDLIELGMTFDPKDKNRYVINLRSLNKCVNYLKELDAMIGMKTVKEMIIDLIFFRLQNFREDKDEMWHLVIHGTPGSGKTEVAKILGKIYYGLGICKKDKFTAAKRSDLIGKYLGHTAKLTQEVFDNASGGILFIDEAYSLGNPEGRDSFSKECIDTINQNLTENKNTIVFIAGYKEQLEESFFSYNPGLNRRFKMRISVDKYNAMDLRQIFIKKLIEDKWEIADGDEKKNIPDLFFEKNHSMFKYNGGDMENLWHLTKIAHARRIFGKDSLLMKKITFEDLEKAFQTYLENDEVKSRKDDVRKYIHDTMYC